MLKVRLAPVLTYNGFALVKTRGFEAARMVGNPIQAARVYDRRGVDELFFLDIMASRQDRNLQLAIVEKVLAECYMPTAVGGGIRSLQDVSDLLAIGADKVVIGRAAFTDLALIEQAASRFGSQAICVALDAKRISPGHYVARGPREDRDLLDLVRNVEACGAGELLVTSIDQDGAQSGYDAQLIERVATQVGIPIVACGGAGTPQHFVDLMRRCPVDALAAASIYHFSQFTPDDVKMALREAGFPVRLAAGPDQAGS